MTMRMSRIPIAMFVLLLLLAVGLVLLSSQTASPQEVSCKWQDLVDAINAGNQAEAEVIAEWLDAHGKSVEIEAVDKAMGRLICAWCKSVIRESGMEEDSHGICGECGKIFLGADE